MEEENNINNNLQYYSNVRGTGVIASLVFGIVVTIAMYIISKFLGY